MRIKLDKNKKLTLLEALRVGYIDDDVITGWVKTAPVNRGEIEKELERIYKLTHPDTCKRLQKLNLCLYSKHIDNQQVN